MQIPNIHILGIQGSGKGTQSALLTEKYGFSYISSGELFRGRAKTEDELGTTIKNIINAGNLIPDKLLVTIIEDHLKNNPVSVGLLGDGAIRTAAQIDLLQPVWEAYGLEQPRLIFMDLSEAIAQERIENRTREQLSFGAPLRHDDTPEAIEKRFQLFHSLTEPVVELFEKEGRCIRISADADVITIHNLLCTALESTYPSLSHVSH